MQTYICPSCRQRRKVDDKFKVGSTGQHVRCGKCIEKSKQGKARVRKRLLEEPV